MVPMVFDPVWDWGSTRISRHDVSSLRGHGTFWSNVAPALRPEMASHDAALGGNQDAEWPHPAGTPEEQRLVFERVWYSVRLSGVLEIVCSSSAPSHCCRLLRIRPSAVPEKSPIGFTSRLLLMEGW